ncbi:MAG: hypothetical protein H0T96_07135 [Thermoleophilaceae bacterium]|nr:hypothetical protein [Thermoleophilaceae bacterium]MDQ3355311.1 hypothetical protein [Actinomycetota bacterium]
MRPAGLGGRARVGGARGLVNVDALRPTGQLADVALQGGQTQAQLFDLALELVAPLVLDAAHPAPLR